MVARRTLLSMYVVVLVGVAMSAIAQTQGQVVAEGEVQGRDGLAQPTVVTLSSRHTSDAASPRLVIADRGIFHLDRIRLRTVSSGTLLRDKFILACVGPRSTRPGGDDVPRSFSAVPAEAHWIRQNKGAFVSIEIDIASPNTETVRQVAAPGGIGGGLTFLARLENDDPVITYNVGGTHADLRGLQVALREAMTKLADEIDRNAGSDFSVKRGRLFFVPHDQDKKAVSFILAFVVEKPGFLWIPRPVASIFVPVSFVFERNAESNGYTVRVNPTDIANRDRITVLLDEGWSSDGDTLLKAARDAVADLDGAFYDTATQRLQRALDRVRPARPAPSDFDVLLFATSHDGTTRAGSSLRLAILE